MWGSSADSRRVLSGSPDDLFQETSARYRALEPEQWLQRHPEAGSSWPSWPKASHSPAVPRARRYEKTFDHPLLFCQLFLITYPYMTQCRGACRSKGS